MWIILLLFLTSVSKPASTIQWPYLQIYPPVNSSDDRTPLYFAVVLSTSGHFPTIRALPGIQIALDYINNEPAILPGYSLHYTLIDSKCHTLGAANSFFRQLLTEPTKLAWIGSGCSVATASTAELTPFYNLTQVSCTSALSENEEYSNVWRYYFQAIPVTYIVAYGYLSIILNFKWKRVSIITQNLDVYISAANTLKEGLKAYGIQYSETIFTEVADIGETTYSSGARIYIWAAEARRIRELACEAHKRGLRYPKYQFLLPGWFPEGFLQDFPSIKIGCNATERMKTLEYSLAVTLQDFNIITNKSGIGEFGFTDFRRLVELKYRDPVNEHLNLSNVTSASPELCYEATLSVALALHKILIDLETNISLRHEAGREANLSETKLYTLANFTYSNFAIVQRMFHHLSSTDFRGINARHVNYNENGRRVSRILQIGQYIITKDGDVTQIKIGVLKNASIDGSYLQIVPADKIWPNGTPTDGMPIIQIIPIYTSNVVVFSILGVIGVIYSLAYIVFNYVNRNKKLIRLSSPNLNYFIGVGALLLYTSMFIFIIEKEGVLIALSYLNVWIINLGYSLFFGTITSKMIRVWDIFNNPVPKKKVTLTDLHLFGILAIFVVVDLLILGGFIIIEGARGNLNFHLAMSAEQPTRLIGPTGEVHEYYYYSVVSSSVLVWYTILGTEKVILGITALVFAFRTRKVKLRGLDDSKFVIMATYAMNICAFPGIAGTLSSLGGHYNVTIAAINGILFISTTTVLSLIFIPKIVALYKDPSGDNIGENNFIVLQKPSQQLCNKDMEKIYLRKQIQSLETQLRLHRKSNRME